MNPNITKVVSYVCEICGNSYNTQQGAEGCVYDHRLEEEDRHCGTCICDIYDKGWNHAEDNDAHCPTCFCHKPIPKKYAEEVFEVLRKRGGKR